MARSLDSHGKAPRVSGDAGPCDSLAPLEGRALTVLFDTTNQCNLRCRMCYFSYDSVFHRRPVLMSTTDFQRIARKVLPRAHTVYLSAGSEPLMHPEFPEILRIAAQAGPALIKVLTNGLLLTPSHDQAFVEHGMGEVHVSMDGACKETYEHIRRGGNFERLKSNLKRLTALKRERGTNSPILQFNITLMRSNLESSLTSSTWPKRLG